MPFRAHETVRLLDAALAAWTVIWLALAFAVAREVRQLDQLGDGAVAAGRALQQTADALDRLGGLPVVGEDLGQIERRVRDAGRRAVRGGREGREDVQRASILLGIVIAAGPIVPTLAVYLPFRLAWARERRAVRAALRRRGAALDGYLAQRALVSLPLQRVTEVSADPLRDLADGRTQALADAELARLGLTRAARR